MAKRKTTGGETIIRKIPHRKLKTEQHTPYYKQVTSGAREAHLSIHLGVTGVAMADSHDCDYFIMFIEIDIYLCLYIEILFFMILSSETLK